MENHSFGDIIGNTALAPYINTLAGECGLATNYHNVSHPSLPNYIALTSGLSGRQLKPFDSDCSPSKKCSTSAPSIFGQGETWKAYEESMPGNCAAANSGQYAVRHNPPPYYTTLAGCSTSDVPYPQLATDVSPSTPAGSMSATLFNHYSLLGTAEELLGLPALGAAASATTMTSAFNL